MKNHTHTPSTTAPAALSRRRFLSTTTEGVGLAALLHGLRLRAGDAD